MQRRVLWAVTIALLAPIVFVAGDKHGARAALRRPAPSPADEAEVKRAVRESQEYEMLKIYTNPGAFDTLQLNKYWLLPQEEGKSTELIEAEVRSLLRRGLRYGPDSQLDKFNFRYVVIRNTCNTAFVGTDEKWFVPYVDKNGVRTKDPEHPNRPEHLTFAGTYILRKSDGLWRVEQNFDPYKEP